MEPSYMPTSDERTMAILAHILALPFPLLGPLLIFLIKKDESAWVAAQSKESLNFQITVAIISLILAITVFGLILLPIVGLLDLIFVIIATINASDNKLFRYPLNFRFIK